MTQLICQFITEAQEVRHWSYTVNVLISREDFWLCLVKRNHCITLRSSAQFSYLALTDQSLRPKGERKYAHVLKESYLV